MNARARLAIAAPENHQVGIDRGTIGGARAAAGHRSRRASAHVAACTCCARTGSAATSSGLRPGSTTKPRSRSAAFAVRQVFLVLGPPMQVEHLAGVLGELGYVFLRLGALVHPFLQALDLLPSDATSSSRCFRNGSLLVRSGAGHSYGHGCTVGARLRRRRARPRTDFRARRRGAAARPCPWSSARRAPLRRDRQWSTPAHPAAASTSRARRRTTSNRGSGPTSAPAVTPHCRCRTAAVQSARRRGPARDPRDRGCRRTARDLAPELGMLAQLQLEFADEAIRPALQGRFHPSSMVPWL